MEDAAIAVLTSVKSESKLETKEEDVVDDSRCPSDITPVVS